jgi:hypothetical protein
MRYVRIYAGADGESHFEDLEFEMSSRGGATSVTELMKSNGILFRHNTAEYFVDWHPAPRRQFVINLTGEVEIEASDGEVRRFGPGSVMLADDTTGKGHISRAVAGQERYSIFVTLEDEE